MSSLAQKLSGIVGEAFTAQGLDASFGRVSVSDRSDLAQFQCNGAMMAAKAAKKNPREVAAAVVEALKTNGAFSKVEIAGPGFINLDVTDTFLADHLATMAQDPRCGVPGAGHGKTVVLDYGGPNIAKAMHVGHLRSAIIGDSIRRILDFAGYNAIGDVHLGDWGTPMGMLIDDYLTSGDVSLVTDADINDGRQVAALEDDMVARYPRAATAAKADPERMDRARAATVALQNKADPHYAIFQKLRDISIAAIAENYARLGVSFQLWKGESDVHDLIAPMVDRLKAEGIAENSDGALVVAVAEESDKKEMPPLILLKRDGAVLYATTDLATIVDRVADYPGLAKIVYIVDQRQGLHFEQVFRAARKGGLLKNDVELTFAGFGTMNGTDGKPFKTRDGGVMRLDDLLDMAVEKATLRMIEAHVGEDMPEDERADIAYKVALAAIKFADLQNARHADYVFDLDRLTSFEGKTGPYLLYQAVRIKSLLAKAGYEEGGTPAFHLQDADRPLALILTEFPDAVDAAIKNYAPHNLCDYAYRLAQAFSSFYGNCHILSEKDLELKSSRMALCLHTYNMLACALYILGISVPERM